jgi:UDP-N-acetylmuramoyl-tripeptide--D-alanyl-D-alanine ligase
MKILKQLVTSLLNQAILRYIRRNNITVIAVAGSIGKTSTTQAIRTVLAQKYRVHIPSTAYNTTKSVHLEFFDLHYATSFFGWLKPVLLVLVKSFGKAPYSHMVIEIGTDHPGEMQEFAWLRPAIGVLTAISPEHMEYFETIDNVAKEELAIASFCDRLFLSANMVDRQLVPNDIANRATWYGVGTEFVADAYRVNGQAVTADFTVQTMHLKAVDLQVLGVHSLNSLVAAAAVGHARDLDPEEIRRGLGAFQPVSGRMQRLQGIKNALIIDDSYNASPEAAKAALDTLYQFDAPQRIAVLGMMNEMGGYSERAHREVGDYCDPQKLQLVVTVGEDANRYLAEAAEEKGCKVERFVEPFSAGEFVKRQLQADAVLLFKGSQNGVFVEEAIKPILKDDADHARLVRQSEFWLDRKAELRKRVD